MERTSALFSTPSLAAWCRLGFTLDARSLAAFRIALGLILVADCVLRFRTLTLMFAPDGVFPPDVLRDFQGTPAIWSLALLGDATWCGAAVLAMEGVAGAWLATGVASRAAAIVAWVATVSVVHRTAPSANAGDCLLVCLLFWSMFLPLGAAWGVRRRSSSAAGSVLSVASGALVLQVAAVYLGAGLAKINPAWLSGTAVSYALSVHDHGSPLGMAVAGCGWLTRPATWAILAIEIGGPLALVLVPKPAVRGSLVAVFMLFHCLVWLTMWVGIFAPVGIAAWLPLVPSTWWDAAAGRRPETAPASLGRPASLACGAAVVVATVSFLHDNGCLGQRPLPRPIRDAIQATALEQHWTMFGEIPLQEQWIYGEGVLADGRVVDVLRQGQPLQRDRPGGGFSSLGTHRWHKLFWNLAREECRVFAAPAAAALARHWNASHREDERIRSLELRFVMLRDADGRVSRDELLLASWPPRGVQGRGNLERLLESTAAEDSVATRGR